MTRISINMCFSRSVHYRPIFRTFHLLSKTLRNFRKVQLRFKRIHCSSGNSVQSVMVGKNKAFLCLFCSTIIHPYICNIDSGIFYSSKNPSIVRKLLQSCQAAVIHSRIQAISSNSNYDSSTIAKRIIWNYSTWLCAF